MSERAWPRFQEEKRAEPVKKSRPISDEMSRKQVSIQARGGLITRSALLPDLRSLAGCRKLLLLEIMELESE